MCSSFHPLGEVIDDHKDESMTAKSFWRDQPIDIHAPHRKEPWIPLILCKVGSISYLVLPSSTNQEISYTYLAQNEVLSQ